MTGLADVDGLLNICIQVCVWLDFPPLITHGWKCKQKRAYIGDSKNISAKTKNKACYEDLNRDLLCSTLTLCHYQKTLMKAFLCLPSTVGSLV